MAGLQLKDLVPGKRYIDEDGAEFEFIAHVKTRFGKEAFAEYDSRIGGMMLFGRCARAFRPAPERHSRIFVIFANPDGTKLSSTFADAEHVKRWAVMHDRKVIAAKQVFITEGEFSEGLQP